MSFWAVVLYTAVILVALLLIALVLVQQSKGGGFGGAFGGLGESILGAQAGSHLTKLTVILSAIFFVLVLAIAVLVAHNGATKDTHDEFNKKLREQPAAVAAPAAEKIEAGADKLKSSATEKTEVKTPAVPAKK